MIEMLSGTSAGSPTVLRTMNSPRRSIFASTEILIGGSRGISPSPRHSPINGSNCLTVGCAMLRSSLALATGGDGLDLDGGAAGQSRHGKRRPRRRRVADKAGIDRVHGLEIVDV